MPYIDCAEPGGQRGGTPEPDALSEFYGVSWEAMLAAERVRAEQAGVPQTRHYSDAQVRELLSSAVLHSTTFVAHSPVGVARRGLA